MKSRLAASTRSTSVWVFCCPTASPVDSVIVNITVAITAIIASNIAAMLDFFGRLIESSWESMFDGPKLPLGRKAPYDPGHAAHRRYRVQIKPAGATPIDYSDVLAGARQRRETTGNSRGVRWRLSRR